VISKAYLLLTLLSLLILPMFGCYRTTQITPNVNYEAKVKALQEENDRLNKELQAIQQSNTQITTDDSGRVTITTKYGIEINIQ
jgi:hypothetical protein